MDEKHSLHHLHNLLPQGQLNHGNCFAGEVVAKLFYSFFGNNALNIRKVSLLGFLNSQGSNWHLE